MIGSLIGLIKEKTPSAILLEVNGIGYEISVPLSTSFQLPKVGESAYLLTHLVVREDQHSLYGFATEEERKLFRALIKISGVGAKLAITILSGTNVSGFIQSVVNEDIDALVHLPGIGKKTAERLIVEMKDKISEISDDESNLSQANENSAVGEAINALVNLGYKTKDAKSILDKIESEDLSVEELIRQALKSLNK
ncbi:MAG: Holliday junction branch migration protein RuvA [Gammaproteobacteria bacterium]|jgi:Holliday junction DNA helicase RuvA|nr:Holliday junction branch migration protein RuvA [Gammaproteobacteria bacterium]MBQ08681.1 Holliday junction branch migration protein RuvA [Gammaproteobacteria bacterium]MDP6146466.1 Holliday junction branch migration protein RuvA [Gammaproteobacteria bacterium]HJL79534.1 Holliday junction branch migration protein RuvA [Gammaproteobacteria bacterium]HJM09216.1 Holliday junction branch migration protein RuvA [Gammaproteobacteria bacterium]|tara:strand:+ start:4923 stop:5510 length:588 start_codon:yes stop_codon:yes gene_type:complete